MEERLTALEERFDQLDADLARPEIVVDHQKVQEVARERAALEPTVDLFRHLKEVDRAIEDTSAILADDGHDPELEDLARDELETLRTDREEVLERLKVALAPTDPNDERSVILEIRGAAGGDEAA